MQAAPVKSTETIRPMVAADREPLRVLLEAVSNFTREEVETALELVDEWLKTGEESGYLTYVQEQGGDPAARRITGYVCFGETPLTVGTFDLYWVAVDSALRSRGNGQALLKFAEAEIKNRGGRLFMIETSSQPTYAGTVAFYEKAGYKLAARIQELYNERDDKLIFSKRL